MTTPPKSPFQALRERAKNRLENIFYSCQDSNSVLFLDPGLDIAVTKIAAPDVIQSCFKKVFTYETNQTEFNFDKLIIFTSGEDQHLAVYIDLLTKTKEPPGEIMVIFANRFTYTHRQYFETRGFLHRIQTRELRLPSWILDPDFASMEISFSFSDQLIEGGGQNIQRISEALSDLIEMSRYMRLNHYFPNVFSIGQAALEVRKSLPPFYLTDWSHIIIFDRSVDCITPFLTAFTYEAIVAELFGIRYGITFLSNGEPLLFGDTDSISAQLRNLPFDNARVTAHEIFQSAKAGLDKKDIRQTAEVVRSNLSIGDHINLIQQIQHTTSLDLTMGSGLNYEMECYLSKAVDAEFIKETIALSDTWHKPVRLLALLCQTSSKPIKDLNDIRQMIIDQFGLEALAALWTLEEAGIICEKKDQKGSWSSVMKQLNLFNKTPDMKNSEKAYEGFTPILLRIMQKIFSRKWDEIYNNLEALKIPIMAEANRCKEVKRVLCIFVGGVTYGEATALRSFKHELRCEIDILATQIYSPKKLLDQLAGIEFS